MIWSRLASYIPSKSSQQNFEQNEVIQEVFSPEVYQLNHSVINKKQEGQIQFSPDEKLQKKKMNSPIY